MLLHGGRTYSPNHLDMGAKLDFILKEFQDLKLSVGGLESKSNKRILENCNDRKMNESTSRLRINEDDIIRKIKIDPLTFDGILDLKILVIE